MVLEPRDDAGVQDPFVEFYRVEFEHAARIAFLLTGSPETAEDVAQEALMRVHRRYEGLDAPRAYLRTVVVNMCRRQRRDRDREGAAYARLLSRPVDLGAQEMLDVIGWLPWRQRAVIVLRYYEDLSEREIAQTLGCRPGTVKSLANRALDRLRRELDG